METETWKCCYVNTKDEVEKIEQFIEQFKSQNRPYATKHKKDWHEDIQSTRMAFLNPSEDFCESLSTYGGVTLTECLGE